MVQWLPPQSHLSQGNPIMCSFFFDQCWLWHHFLLCSIVFPPLIRPKLAHSIGEVSSYVLLYYIAYDDK